MFKGISWDNPVERFAVVMNNKIIQGGSSVVSATYNDLRSIWFDGADEMSNEEWFHLVDSTPELKNAFNVVIGIYKDLYPYTEKSFKLGTLYKFQVL